MLTFMPKLIIFVFVKTSTDQCSIFPVQKLFCRRPLYSLYQKLDILQKVDLLNLLNLIRRQ